MEEKSLLVTNGLNISQLRKLRELQSINHALNTDELCEIAIIYHRAIDRLFKENSEERAKGNSNES